VKRAETQSKAENSINQQFEKEDEKKKNDNEESLTNDKIS